MWQKCQTIVNNRLDKPKKSKKKQKKNERNVRMTISLYYVRLTGSTYVTALFGKSKVDPYSGG